MIKIWGKLIKNHKIIKDAVLEYKESGSRSEMVKLSLNDFALELDIARPIWLPKNEKDLSQFIVTTFFADQFLEGVDFDSFVIEIISQDKKKQKTN